MYVPLPFFCNDLLYGMVQSLNNEAAILAHHLCRIGFSSQHFPQTDRRIGKSAED